MRPVESACIMRVSRARDFRRCSFGGARITRGKGKSNFWWLTLGVRGLRECEDYASKYGYDSFVAHFESEPNRNVSVTKCQGILKTNLVFKCDAAKDISIGNDTLLAKLPFDGIKGSDDCERNLTVPFSGACGTKPAAASAGLSAGSVLLILFFVGVLLYLVGGVILKHNSGARGWEMLPHQQFWSELPSLIVEGCVYFVKLVTCQATSGTGANRSYDDI